MRGDRRDDDLSEELEAHLELLVDEHVRAGMSQADARRAAHLDMGGVTQVAEAVRDVRPYAWLGRIAQDARYALRMLWHAPAFTLAAVATLAIGIAANTAMFTVVDAVLLRTLPVHDPSQLIAIGIPTAVGGHTTGGARGDLLSVPLYRDLRDHNRFVTDLAATGTAGRLYVRADHGDYEHPVGRYVSGNYFAVLGVAAARGRVYSAGDDVRSHPSPAIIISDGYWRRRFGGASDVVGRDLLVNGVKLTIVGIAPRGFNGDVIDRPTDLWLPISMAPIIDPHGAPTEDRGTSWLLLLGRLAPGVTIDQARSGFTTLIRQFLVATARSADEGVRFQTARTVITSGAKGFSALRHTYSLPLITLQVGVGLLMLIVCTNVANLLLSRSVSRRREISVRLALGASRSRLVTQLLTESVVLAVAGCLAGFLLAAAGTSAVIAAAAGGSLGVRTSADHIVVLFTVGLTICTVLCFGLIPAIRGSRADLASVTRGGRLTAGAHASGIRVPVGRLLIPLQVTLSLVLLVAAALLSRSLARLAASDSGLDRDHVLVVDLDVGKRGYTGDRFLALAADLRTRIAALPGVAAVSYSQNGLFSAHSSNAMVSIPGVTGRTPEDSTLNYDFVGPGYLEAIGAHVLRGREIGAMDRRHGPSVVVVNLALERFYFGNTSALGKTIFFDPGIPTTIVGVVADFRDHSLIGVPERTAYALYDQNIGDVDQPSLIFVVRATGDPVAVSMGVRAAVEAADPALPIASLTPLSTLMRESIREEWLLATLADGFGLVALLLAAIGLYGVMAYAVAQRTGEIGIRRALGASRGRVIGLVLSDGLRLVSVGLLVGMPLALIAARLLRGELYGVAPTDPASAVTAFVVLLTSAIIAGLIPALRASRVPPVVALRQD
jgi:predicted permease